MERSRTRVQENQREGFRRSQGRDGGGNGEERWIGKIFRKENRQLMEMCFNVGSEGQGDAKDDS